MSNIAALFVEAGGVYYGLPDVEPWGLPDRDARDYSGSFPVVAHPPCSRWCKLAGLVEARWGHKRGDDGGCFKAALDAVDSFGGVLEHPAHSRAWKAFDIRFPPKGGGWVSNGFGGGWTCHVEQGKYGHPAHKATWLYARGVDLPSLNWGRARNTTAVVSWCASRSSANDTRRRVGKAEAARSPVAFRDVLIAMARTAA